MRILHVAAFPFPTPQGSQVYVRGILRALARRGHEASLLCYGYGQDLPDEGYMVHRIPNLGNYRKYRAGPDLTKPILDLMLALRLRKLSADVIHVHNYEAPLVAMLAHAFRDIPMVYSAHNTMSEELPTYYRSKAARTAAGVLGTVLDRTIPQRADVAIAIRPKSKKILSDLGCRRVECVPPGIDEAEISVALPVNLPPGPWVIYTGNPDGYQDLPVLFEAMKLLPKVGLLMVSASDLEHLHKLHLPKLKTVRTNDFQQVRRYLSSAQIAVLPRSVCSGFPMKILNYLGMGLPTVVAQGSNVGFDGCVEFKNGCHQDLASKIQSLLDSPQKLEKMSQKACSGIREKSLWNVRVLELERIYQSLLKD
ncbi:MAG: hypothetical protein CMK59_04510 [Proteobacteria bacterium]|nr:hypothetical protein [Pseudomonadota bacterium]